jgi:hypothetical protein
LNPELTESIATLFNGASYFGAEPVARERIDLHTIEPDRARIPNLALERKRLLVK